MALGVEKKMELEFEQMFEEESDAGENCDSVADEMQVPPSDLAAGSSDVALWLQTYIAFSQDSPGGKFWKHASLMKLVPVQDLVDVDPMSGQHLDPDGEWIFCVGQGTSYVRRYPRRTVTRLFNPDQFFWTHCKKHPVKQAKSIASLLGIKAAKHCNSAQASKQTEEKAVDGIGSETAPPPCLTVATLGPEACQGLPFGTLRSWPCLRSWRRSRPSASHSYLGSRQICF
jgi:hypothetical protein